jgi:hypothetical protein
MPTNLTYLPMCEREQLQSYRDAQPRSVIVLALLYFVTNGCLHTHSNVTLPRILSICNIKLYHAQRKVKQQDRVIQVTLAKRGAEIAQSVQRLATGWTNRGVGFPDRLKKFFFSTSSRPALGPIQSPIQSVTGANFPGLKRPGSDADHTSN